MKTTTNILYILLIFIALTACVKKENHTNLTVEKWHLVEQLLDPGDGSGVFVPVESEKIIELSSDSSFLSNGSMCSMTSASNEPSTGFYSSTEFIPDNCSNQGMLTILYEINDDEMILRYQCFEACAQKYTKIN